MISKDDVLYKLDQAFCAQIEKLFSVLHVERHMEKLHDGAHTGEANARFTDGLRHLVETHQAAAECVKELFPVTVRGL